MIFNVHFIWHLETNNKVNRCLARFSPCATTTNQPTNRVLNESERPGPNDQKCQFRAKFGRKSFGAKSFGTNLKENPPTHLVRIVFYSGTGPNGPKILIFMGVSKSFGNNITENHLDNLSTLFLGQVFGRFGPKIHFFGGRE